MIGQQEKFCFTDIGTSPSVICMHTRKPRACSKCKKKRRYRWTEEKLCRSCAVAASLLSLQDSKIAYQRIKDGENKRMGFPRTSKRASNEASLPLFYARAD